MEVFGSNIHDMNKVLTGCQTPVRSFRAESLRALQELHPRFRHSAGRRYLEKVAVIGPQLAEASFAEPQRLFEQGIENRSEIARRAVDDL